MAKVRRQGGSTPNYTETGLAEWFSRLDISQGKPIPLPDDDNVASPTTSTRTPLSDLKPSESPRSFLFFPSPPPRDRNRRSADSSLLLLQFASSR